MKSIAVTYNFDIKKTKLLTIPLKESTYTFILQEGHIFKEDMMYFYDLLKEKREKKGLSLEELSNLTQISKNTLKMIEHGKALPSIQGLLSICKILETTPNEMLLDVSFDYPKFSHEYHYGIRSIQPKRDVKPMSQNEKIQYIALLKKRKGNVYSALIQRKLGVPYREAQELLETVCAME